MGTDEGAEWGDPAPGLNVLIVVYSGSTYSHHMVCSMGLMLPLPVCKLKLATFRESHFSDGTWLNGTVSWALAMGNRGVGTNRDSLLLVEIVVLIIFCTL
jgi:hypothetical protein